MRERQLLRYRVDVYRRFRGAASSMSPRCCLFILLPERRYTLDMSSRCRHTTPLCRLLLAPARHAVMRAIICVMPKSDDYWEMSALRCCLLMLKMIYGVRRSGAPVTDAYAALFQSFAAVAGDDARQLTYDSAPLIC